MVKHHDYSLPGHEQVKAYGVRTSLRGSVPTFMAGDKPFWGLIYTFDPYDDRPYIDCLKSMYDQGVRIFSFLLPLAVAWKRDGCDFSLLDELHDRIIESVP